MSTLRQEFRDFLNSVIAFPADYFAGWFGVAPAESGVEVNELTAMQIAAYVGCLRVLSSSVGQTQLHVLEKRVDAESGHKQEVRAEEHPLEFMLSMRPNPEVSAAGFFETIMVHLLMTGNSYAEKAYNGAGQLAALYLRNPFRTIPYRMADGTLFYKTNETPTGFERNIKAEEMLHFRGLGMDSLVGLSPVKYYAREVLGGDLAAQSFSAKFFANDSRPGGYLKSANIIAKEKKKEAMTSWIAAHSRGNANSMAVLDGGLTWEKVGVNPEEAQFLETRKFNREQIAAIFGVPVHYLGETVESRLPSESRERELLNRTLQIWFTKIEQEINAKLFSPLGRNAGRFRARFDLTTFAQPSYSDMVKGLQMARYAGLMTTNEGRKALGLQPYSAQQHASTDPADKLLQAVNMQLVPESAEEMQPAAGGKGTQGAGGNDQAGGDGKGTGKPPRQGGQGGQRDKELERYFRLFFRQFDDALGRILSRSKLAEKDFRGVFEPVLVLIASTFSFRADAEPGDMVLPEPTIAFIREYIGFLAHRGKDWKAENRAEIAAKELRRALEVFREKCSHESEEEGSEKAEEVEED